MNILFVPSWYQSETNPILGSFFREQALALSQNGHRIYIADATLQRVNNYKSKRLCKLCKFVDEDLITYSYVVPSFGAYRLPRIGVEIYYRNLLKIYKALKDDGVNIDIIHAHVFYPAGIAATRLGKKVGIPVVVTEHNSLVLTQNLTKGHNALLKETVENSDKFICVSEALKDSVINLTNTSKQVYVIPNIVSSLFNYKEKIMGQQFTYISIGNLVKSKRFDLTLRAFAKCYQKFSSMRLVIVGEGPLRKELEQLALNLGILDAVSFKGRLSRDKVLHEFNKSNVFVLPSDFETFGVVYIEALACGCPVIATKNGGANDIVTNSNGFLVDVDSEQQLCESMIQAYTNYNKYDRRAISDKARYMYGEEKFVVRISQLYDHVLNDL